MNQDPFDIFLEEEEDEKDQAPVVFSYIPKIDSDDIDDEASIYEDFEDEKNDIDF